jgi:hypothetical protein
MYLKDKILYIDIYDGVLRGILLGLYLTPLGKKDYKKLRKIKMIL